MKKPFFAIALSALAGCSSQPDQPITIEAPNPALYASRTAAETSRYLLGLDRPVENDVSIRFNYVEKDRLGNKTEKPLFVYHFTKETVNAAKFENLRLEETMELLSKVEVLSPFAETTVYQICAPAPTIQFCKLAMADLIQKKHSSAGPLEPQSKPAR